MPNILAGLIEQDPTARLQQPHHVLQISRPPPPTSRKGKPASLQLDLYCVEAQTGRVSTVCSPTFCSHVGFFAEEGNSDNDADGTAPGIAHALTLKSQAVEEEDGQCCLDTLVYAALLTNIASNFAV